MKRGSLTIAKATALLSVGALIVVFGVATPAWASAGRAISSVSTPPNEIVIGHGGTFDMAGQPYPDIIWQGTILNGSGQIQSSENGTDYSWHNVSDVTTSVKYGMYDISLTFIWQDGSQQTGQLSGEIGGGPDGETLVSGTLGAGSESPLTFANMVITSTGLT